jgi:hypothetical protein
VLRAYFDGSQTDGKCLTLACLAGDEATWSEVLSAWARVRKERGNPACLHMTDAMALKGDFAQWTSDARDFLVDGFLGVLNNFRHHARLHSFSCTVDLVAHERWKQIRRHPSPARLCARFVVPHMLDWYGKFDEPLLLPDSVDFFFDRSEPFMRHIHADWTSKKIRSRYLGWRLIRNVAPVIAENTPELQITDMIAWGRNRLQSGSHWETDQHYTTAVRAANTLQGLYTVVDENALASSNFREEGFEALRRQPRKSRA